MDGVVGAGVHELRVSQTPFLKDCGDAAHSFGASWKPLELKAGGIHTRSFVFFDSPLGNVSGLGEFKRELEGGAHTFLRLKTDFAVEFPDDLLGYEKAQTDPLGVNLLWVLHKPKQLEKLTLIFFGDAYSGVLNLHVQIRIVRGDYLCAHRYEDVTSLGKLHGVALQS